MKDNDTYLITDPYLYSYPTMFINNSSPIFLPRRRKFKGWMRENRKSTFNKNR